jgi:hypothetical protein
MGGRDSYEASVQSALARIAEHVPEDIVAQFAEKSGITRNDIRPISPGHPGLVSAVDGSNVMILEGGTIALAAIRAARTTFNGAARTGRATTPILLVTIGPERHNRDFEDLFRECFGIPPHKGLDNSDPLRASDILRDTLEYWVTLKAAETMPAGSLLLMDGALRVSNQNHEPVLTDIIRKAGERGLLLAAVAKRTKATWGNGHPLLPALMGLAQKSGVSGMWWTKIDPHLLDNTEYRQGRHGEIYVASLHPRMTRLMKIELPRGISEDTAEKTMQALAKCADDGRIPGYPYPLFDAHRAVVIDEAIATQVQQDIKGGLARQGIQNRLFEDLFGDLHDDFDRY